MKQQAPTGNYTWPIARQRQQDHDLAKGRDKQFADRRFRSRRTRKPFVIIRM